MSNFDPDNNIWHRLIMILMTFVVAPAMVWAIVYIMFSVAPGFFS